MFLRSAVFGSLLLSSQAWGLYANKSVNTVGGQSWTQVTVDLDQSANLDILFVVDDSGSMQEHQNNLAVAAPNIAQFLSTYGDVNAAVVTTSMIPYKASVPAGGAFHGGVVNSRDPSFAARLASNILVGTSGDAYEKPIETMMNALAAHMLNGVNANFLRAKADFMVVFLTDTDDQGLVKPRDAARFLRGLKPNNTIHALYSSVDPTSATCLSEQFTTTNLQDFITDINGLNFDLCGDLTANFVAALPQVNNSAKSVINVTPTYGVVDAASIKVSLDGVVSLVPGDLKNGFIYDSTNGTVTIGNQVSLSGYKQIIVDYKVK